MIKENINTNTLNPQQESAVKQTEGPVIIIAGPGSGKTRVITERIAHLINKGIEPQNILALTFTNKAANEMKKRVYEITNTQAAYSVWMGTFHSIFAKILRKEAHILGYDSNFTIYDNEDSIKIIRRIIKDRNLDKEQYNPKYVFSKISIMKNQLIDSQKYKQNAELIKHDQINKREKFVELYQEYCESCTQSNSMDFDDLLINTYHLLSKNKLILTEYQELFKYILIDEYQDTNKVQDAIIQQLGEKYQNICIVGDDSQSIYSFRGANINNIFNFKSNYQNVKEFKLEQNYRSTKNIVHAANTLINFNKQKIEKTIFSKNENGDPIQLIEYYNDRNEGDKTAEIIYRLICHNPNTNHQHAILYRNNSQSKVIEDGLRKRRIKYKIYGGLSFYQRKEIKDIMAYFKLIVNPDDNESLLRIINYPVRGIGSTTINKLRGKANSEKKSIWKILSYNNLENIQINSGTKNKLNIFKEILNELFKSQNSNIFETAELLIEKTGIVRKLKDNPTDENINRLENISELFNSVKLFSLKKTNNSILDFINEVSLDETNKETSNKSEVSLMTIHQSKGLEFPYVYIVGLENGLFPSQRSLKIPSGVEEERRLLYVAITRASKKVTLSYSLNRFQFGTIQQSEKSMFIDNIEHCLNKEIKNEFNQQLYFKKPRTNKINSQTKINPIGLRKVTNEKYRDSRNLQIGMKIKHNIFGKGSIQKINNSDGNQKITVIFEEHGLKILLTKFAKFEIIM
ncbi:MAG: ATP-dependent DNA helicase [Flavobacteriales bacterium]|nr:ATP-dependent DNA helicase [Flavobacteriales bacterium]